MKELPEVPSFAHAIGPRSILTMHQPFVDLAKSLELVIHPWYVRDDFLDHTSNAFDENMLYYNMGVEGIFSEFTHTTQQTYDKAGPRTNDVYVKNQFEQDYSEEYAIERMMAELVEDASLIIEVDETENGFLIN